MKNINYSSILLILVIGFLGTCAAKTVKGVSLKDYPVFTTERNTTDSLPHLNDSTLHVYKFAKEPDYGYTESKPIFLGVRRARNGAANRIKFFNALAGPNGEELTCQRIESCCPFRTPNSETIDQDQKFGLLDVWEVTYKGLEKPLILYVNLYDEGTPKVPKGLTLKYKQALSKTQTP
jgi:hypothetical protein